MWLYGANLDFGYLSFFDIRGFHGFIGYIFGLIGGVY